MTADSVSVGEQLLATISSRERMSWAGFRSLVDQLGPDSKDIENPRVFLWQTVRNLQAIGHIEIEPRKRSRYVYVCPSALVRLPIIGKPKYLLVGRRGSNVEQQLERSIDRFELTIETERVETDGHGYCPDRVTISGEDSRPIHELSNDLNIELAEGFPAYDIMATASTLQDYEELLDFTQEENRYSRGDGQYFSKRKEHFIDGRSRDLPRLEKFSEPYTKLDACFFVQKDGSHARVATDWGRYLYYYAIGRPPFTYLSTTFEFYCPLHAPLPLLYDRSLSLCSGRPATIKIHNGTKKIRYLGVPQKLVEMIRTKLGKVAVM
jgi:hypothetical protein